jgi:hydrogenase expression/formation protein HypE
MPPIDPVDGTPGCPLPIGDGGRVQLAHGGGGRLTGQLLERVFYPAFDNVELARRHDAALVPVDGQAAFTTDAYVVSPLFFPGGDIGTLAINGTVNDLAMAGARARWISAAFILEEGLALATLERVVASMASAARQAGVSIVTGDLKVVERGKADGCYITTAGIGEPAAPARIGPQAVRPGDLVLLSGDVGRHGMAVMMARGDLGFETAIASDCAPLAGPVLALLEAGVRVRCLRDLTRGGLATALVEIALLAGLEIGIEEQAVAVPGDVRAACELLGLDPLYVANEGRFVAFVDPADAPRALELMHAHPVSHGAVVIGEVTRALCPGQVLARGLLGQQRMIDLLSGEQLPRIC